MPWASSRGEFISTNAETSATMAQCDRPRAHPLNMSPLRSFPEILLILLMRDTRVTQRLLLRLKLIKVQLRDAGVGRLRLFLLSQRSQRRRQQIIDDCFVRIQVSRLLQIIRSCLITIQLEIRLPEKVACRPRIRVGLVRALEIRKGV